MSEKQYFPVPLAHITSPIAPPLEPELPHAREGTAAEPSGEPFGMLDAEELPELLGIDEVTLLARDPYTLFGHWEATPEARGRAGAGDLVLRLSAASRPGGPVDQLIDEKLARDAGRGYLPAPYPGAVIDAALGVRGAAGGFTPIAFAPRLRVPYDAAEEGPVEWMRVVPGHTGGLRLEPPVPVMVGPADAVPGASRAGLPLERAAGAAPSSHVLASLGAPSSPAPSSPAPSSPAAATLPSSPTRSGR